MYMADTDAKCRQLVLESPYLRDNGIVFGNIDDFKHGQRVHNRIRAQFPYDVALALESSDVE